MPLSGSLGIALGVCWVPWLSKLMLFTNFEELLEGFFLPLEVFRSFSLPFPSVVPKVALKVTEVPLSLFQFLLCSSENSSFCRLSGDSRAPCSPPSSLLPGPSSEF